MTTEVTNSRMLPQIDDDSRLFWEGAHRHELIIQYCPACRKLIHHPRPVCPHCRSSDLEGKHLTGRGAVYTYTVTEQAFHPYWVDRVPYVLVVVDLEEQPGLRFVAQLVDCHPDDAHIGMPVEIDWEDVTDEVTVPVFRPQGGAGLTAGRQA